MDRTINAPRTTIQMTGRVEIAPFYTVPVKNARVIAKVLDHVLATAKETIFDISILTEMRERRGLLLAVDSKDLPREKGLYEVERTNVVNFKLINEIQAQALIRQGRWYDLLFLSKSAANAAKEERPVALVSYSGRGRNLSIVVCPGENVQVAIVKPKDNVRVLERKEIL